MLKLSNISTFLGTLLILATCSGLASCSWWQKHKTEVDCAAITTVEDAPILLTIVTQCTEIAINPSAILPCIEGAAGSKWTTDVLQCFYAAQQGKTECPAFAKAKTARSAAHHTGAK